MRGATVLLLPGQGAQYPGMAVEVYRRDPGFAEVVDEFLDAMGTDGRRLRAGWLAGGPVAGADDGRLAQPLLFLVGYAAARTLIARGVAADILIGHSVGELAAAAVAGVLDLRTAARVIVRRGHAIAGTPAGGMLAVAATPEQVAPWTGERVVVGAHNAPRQTVLAGPETDLARVETALRAAGLTCRRLAANQPWHSPSVAGVVRGFTEVLAAETLRPPRIQIRSTHTTRAVTAAEATRPGFWAGQLSAPVLFWPALSTVLTEGAGRLIETGPGTGLSTPARGHPTVRSGQCTVETLLPGKGIGEWTAWCRALERLGAA
ncbi:acyltransferase domain-containing protein [Actinophytocola sediminis]